MIPVLQSQQFFSLLYLQHKHDQEFQSTFLLYQQHRERQDGKHNSIGRNQQDEIHRFLRHQTKGIQTRTEV